MVGWTVRALVCLAMVGCSCTTGVTGGDGAIPFPDAGPWDAGHDAGPGFADATLPDAGSLDGGETGCLGEEVCDNGLDDDCDGAVDEDCACLPGTVAGCFRGTAAQRGVGACMDGSMTCMDGLEFGTWGPCEGDVAPSDEVCDADGVDENCDGAPNEGCDCSPDDPPAPCGLDVGACRPGSQTCVEGRLGACMGGTGPVGEVCNNTDDDCDGLVDEGISRVCGTDVGVCTMGVERCAGGRFEACVGGTSPGVEICNGLDDDCDGSTDESLTRACGSGVGACRAGTQTCTAATWSACTGETLPMLETCDNTDEDCDGRTDEGVTRGCGSSTGVCRPGTQTCSRGTFGACMGGVTPGTEVCDGSDDENCDGTVDEGCVCTAGMTRACGSNTGVCIAGTQTCDGTGWLPCSGATGPTPEVCNGLDDDCDGAADEDGICPTAPPIVMCPGAISADVLDTVSLAGSGSDPDGGPVTFEWTVTTAPPGSTSMPASPTSPSTNFFLDASGGFVLELCVTDDEGERACCTVSIDSVPPGALHVELSWDTAYGDVDLHLLDVTQSHPNGWWQTSDCYFANRTPDWGPAGIDANPTLDLDDTDGFGPENTTIDVNPAAGTYTVGLHYFCSHSIGTGAAPGDGPTNATVRIFCDGALIATYTGVGLTSTDDWITVAEVDYPSCRARRRTTTTVGNALYPASFTAPRHCEISCSSAADCPTGERCVRAMGGGPPRNICYL